MRRRQTPIGQHFFSMTRGRLVQLLRRSPHTVDELTEQLGLTRTAVREHLARLERDGLVQQSGVRRGIGKPAHLYALSPAARELFARGYAPVLQGLLDVLAGRLDPADREALLRDVGRRLAARHPTPSGDIPERLAAGAELLNDLGGLAEVQKVNGSFVIQGWSCPLASVVQEHPELCHVPETLLSELLGLPVQEQCDRHDPPRCRFAVASGPNGTSPEE